jgi:hypothetical protein
MKRGTYISYGKDLRFCFIVFAVLILGSSFGFAQASIPYYEDFEKDSLGAEWKSYSSITPDVQGIAAYHLNAASPHWPDKYYPFEYSWEGAYMYSMKQWDYLISAKALELSIDLSGHTGVALSFRYQPWLATNLISLSDTTSALPSGDGVIISHNGLDWYRAYSFNQDANYKQFHRVDLDSVINHFGITYSDNFKIRFVYSDSLKVYDGDYNWDYIQIHPKNKYRVITSSDTLGQAFNYISSNTPILDTIVTFGTTPVPVFVREDTTLRFEMNYWDYTLQDSVTYEYFTSISEFSHWEIVSGSGYFRDSLERATLFFPTSDSHIKAVFKSFSSTLLQQDTLYDFIEHEEYKWFYNFRPPQNNYTFIPQFTGFYRLTVKLIHGKLPQFVDQNQDTSFIFQSLIPNYFSSGEYELDLNNDSIFHYTFFADSGVKKAFVLRSHFLYINESPVEYQLSIAHSDSLTNQAYLPFREYFSQPVLRTSWSVYSDQPDSVFQNQIQPGYFFRQNSQSVSNKNLMVLELSVNLEEAQDYYLCFSHKGSGSNTIALPPVSTGYTQGDGVLISQDGINWHRVVSFDSPSTISEFYYFALDSLLDELGLNFSQNYKIRFQHYANSESDPGFEWDDIFIESPEFEKLILYLDPLNPSIADTISVHSKALAKAFARPPPGMKFLSWQILNGMNIQEMDVYNENTLVKFYGDRELRAIYGQQSVVALPALGAAQKTFSFISHRWDGAYPANIRSQFKATQNGYYQIELGYSANDSLLIRDFGTDSTFSSLIYEQKFFKPTIDQGSYFFYLDSGNVRYLDWIKTDSTYSNESIRIIVALQDSNRIAQLPYYEDFEKDSLGAEWSTYFSHAWGRQLITSTYSPYAGSKHYQMDVSVSGTNNLNALDLTLDLQAQTNLELSFYHKMYTEESDPLPDSAIGYVNGDGIMVSPDGIHWYRALSMVGSVVSLNWKQFNINLDSVANHYEFSYGPQSKIRFQQYDNYPVTSDGFFFDEIQVRSIAKVNVQVNKEVAGHTSQTDSLLVNSDEWTAISTVPLGIQQFDHWELVSGAGVIEDSLNTLTRFKPQTNSVVVAKYLPIPVSPLSSTPSWFAFNTVGYDLSKMGIIGSSLNFEYTPTDSGLHLLKAISYAMRDCELYDFGEDPTFGNSGTYLSIARPEEVYTEPFVLDSNVTKYLVWYCPDVDNQRDSLLIQMGPTIPVQISSSPANLTMPYGQVDVISGDTLQLIASHSDYLSFVQWRGLSGDPLILDSLNDTTLVVFNTASEIQGEFAPNAEPIVLDSLGEYRLNWSSGLYDPNHPELGILFKIETPEAEVKLEIRAPNNQLYTIQHFRDEGLSEGARAENVITYDYLIYDYNRIESTWFSILMGSTPLDSIFITLRGFKQVNITNNSSNINMTQPSGDQSFPTDFPFQLFANPTGPIRLLYWQTDSGSVQWVDSLAQNPSLQISSDAKVKAVFGPIQNIHPLSSSPLTLNNQTMAYSTPQNGIALSFVAPDSGEYGFYGNASNLHQRIIEFYGEDSLFQNKQDEIITNGSFSTARVLQKGERVFLIQKPALGTNLSYTSTIDVKRKYQLKVNARGPGIVSPTQPLLVPEGQDQLLSSSPVLAHYLTHWESNRPSAQFSDSLMTPTYVRIFEDTEITGVFKKGTIYPLSLEETQFQFGTHGYNPHDVGDGILVSFQAPESGLWNLSFSSPIKRLFSVSNYKNNSGYNGSFDYGSGESDFSTSIGAMVAGQIYYMIIRSNTSTTSPFSVRAVKLSQVVLRTDGRGAIIGKDTIMTEDITGVPVEAKGHTGYRFSHWSVVSGQAAALAPGSRKTNILATGDAVLQANFKPGTIHDVSYKEKSFVFKDDAYSDQNEGYVRLRFIARSAGSMALRLQSPSVYLKSLNCFGTDRNFENSLYHGATSTNISCPFNAQIGDTLYFAVSTALTNIQNSFSIQITDAASNPFDFVDISTTVPGGLIMAWDSVSFSLSHNSAQVYYTLDGSEPDTLNGNLWDGRPFYFDRDTTLKAIAIAPLVIPSATLTEVYKKSEGASYFTYEQDYQPVSSPMVSTFNSSSTFGVFMHTTATNADSIEVEIQSLKTGDAQGIVLHKQSSTPSLVSYGPTNSDIPIFDVWPGNLINAYSTHLLFTSSLGSNQVTHPEDQVVLTQFWDTLQVTWNHSNQNLRFFDEVYVRPLQQQIITNLISCNREPEFFMNSGLCYIPWPNPESDLIILQPADWLELDITDQNFNPNYPYTSQISVNPLILGEPKDTLTIFIGGEAGQDTEWGFQANIQINTSINTTALKDNRLQLSPGDTVLVKTIDPIDGDSSIMRYQYDSIPKIETGLGLAYESDSLFVEYRGHYLKSKLKEIPALVIVKDCKGLLIDQELVNLSLEDSIPPLTGIWRIELPITKNLPIRQNAQLERTTCSEFMVKLQEHQPTGLAGASTIATISAQDYDPPIELQVRDENHNTPNRYSQELWFALNEISLTNAIDTISLKAVCPSSLDTLFHKLIESPTPTSPFKYQSLTPLLRTESLKNNFPNRLFCRPGERINIIYSDPIFNTSESLALYLQDTVATRLQIYANQLEVLDTLRYWNSDSLDLELLLITPSPNLDQRDTLGLSLQINYGPQRLLYAYEDPSNLHEFRAHIPWELLSEYASIDNMKIIVSYDAAHLKDSLVIIKEFIKPFAVWIIDSDQDAYSDELSIEVPLHPELLKANAELKFGSEYFKFDLSTALLEQNSEHQGVLKLDIPKGFIPRAVTDFNNSNKVELRVQGSPYWDTTAHYAQDKLGPVVVQAELIDYDMQNSYVAVELSEKLVYKSGNLKQIFVVGGACDQADNDHWIYVDIVELSTSDSLDFLLKLPKGLLPVGACLSLNSEPSAHNLKDRHGNTPVLSGVPIQTNLNQDRNLKVSPVPEIAGLGSSNYWVAPVALGETFDRGRLEQLPDSLSTLLIISKHPWTAEFSIFDQFGNFLYQGEQDFGYRGELSNPARSDIQGQKGWLAWNQRSIEGRQAATGVYIWKVQIKFEAEAKAQEIILRSGIMR